MRRKLVGRARKASEAPPDGGASDWPTARAGWVVPAAGVLGLPTSTASGLSREIIDLCRDLLDGPSVGTAMTAALEPRTRWWDGLLLMAREAGAAGPGGGATAPTPPPRDDSTEGRRPDADLLDPDPADQLATLTRRHADAVYRVALSVTRDHDLAEDVSQDALLKAWQALPTFRGDAPLKNWLLRITHNTAISALRRRRDVHLDPVDIPDEAPSAHSAPPVSVEHRVEERASIDAFEAALSELDELSRAVVVLREVEGMSYDEISQVLDVPLPTVKTRLLRARRVLAAALEGWKP